MEYLHVNTFKHRIALLAVFSGFAMLASSASYAGNNNTLKVTASITGTCNFSAANVGAGNTTLDFGSLDQTLSTNASATQTSLNYWCTSGTNVGSISADNGMNAGSCSGTPCLKNTVTGLDFIKYSLLYTDPAGTMGAGKTSPLTVTFDGTILNADYVNAPAGTYEDFITLTITP